MTTPRSGDRIIFRLFLKLTLLGLLLLCAAGAWVAAWLYQPLPFRPPQQEFVLRAGSTLRGAAQQLYEAGVLADSWRFVWLARALHKETAIKAGDYALSQPVTPLQLLEKITAGDVTQTSITLVEGWNLRQIRQTLDQHTALKHDTRGLDDAAVLRLLGAGESHGEGLFFPETYFVAAGSSELAILRRAYRLMQKNLAASWATRAPGLPYKTAYEALILASIVEKETGQVAERPQIAAVFLNRLRLGMRLQTDPTVIYGLGPQFDGNLRKRDLQADTPYNTYTRTGLPPTPIASPGSAALQAVMQPARSNALYFVAKGDGSHQFSDNLADHNRAVHRYQRGGR